MSCKEGKEIKSPTVVSAAEMVAEERHISFSFNVDFDNSDSCDSADSETANLKIDVSEVHDSNPPNKRKRLTDEETNVLNEMEEEIERQLDAKAAKTNLTPINVKNILKHVISDESVRAMVQRQLKNSTDDPIFEPKLTRSKAKELAISQPNLLPISPVTKPPSEVQALIETELSEDSSDEEYDPESEEQSDDERETENSVGSDVDSLPSTPKITEPTVTVDEQKSAIVKYDNEGVFKIPGTPPPLLEEEESIGQRTRSKLSLSETPLEHIEQAFIPPDITTDMYDWDVDCLEPEYKKFLTEYLKPLNQDPIVDDDPEADPEYNFMEDIETDMVDKEEFREDRGVEISRKELNDLMRSLYDFGDNNLKKEQEAKKKKKISDNFTANNENNVMTNTTINPVPVSSESDEPKVFTREQQMLLQVQLEQHVQMLTQTYLTTYKHPEYHSISLCVKGHIDSFKYLSSGPNSAYNIRNLNDAEETIKSWQCKLSNPDFLKNYTTMVNGEIIAEKVHVKKKLLYIPRFHPELKATFMESKALLYPHLLPHTFPRIKGKAWNKFPYFNSEENLIVLGLEKYYPIILKKETKFKRKADVLSDVIDQVQKNLLPTRDFSSLLNYVRKSCRNKEKSLIKQFMEKKIVPRTIHKIAFDERFNPTHNKAPKDQPIEFLPDIWKNKSTEEGQFKRHNLKKIINENIRSSLKNQVPADSLTNRPVSIVITVPSQEEAFKVIISDDTLDPVSVPRAQPEEAPSDVRTNNNPFNQIFIRCENQIEDEFILPDSHSPVKEDSKIETNVPKDSIKVEKEFSNNIQMEDQFVSPDSCSPVKQDPQYCETSPSTVSVKIEKDVLNKILMSPSESSNSQMEENETSLVESTKSFEDEKNDEGYKLRKTTPRLAKIRSAENMKMMTQVLGPKSVSSSCSGAKNKAKQDSSKTDDECSSTKGDNEDEIAELMLASTTIKKDTISRKKAKQARELENIKRLVESENDNNHEERAAKYAVSFFQKLQSSLINCDPDTFRSVVNLYLTYCEKVNTLDQLESESESKEMQDTDSATMSSVATDRCKDKFSDVKDEVAAELYTKVCDKLSAYPELCSDFLLFLSPRQADIIDKSVEYTMLQKMKEFINVAQVYFAKQPSRLVKITQALTSLASDPLCTIESVKDTMSPILKGHPVVMDLFMQVLPDGKPPNCLFAPHMFENLICPVGPQDKNKVFTEDSAELYENIKLPVSTSHDDPYGGESCKCDCHTTVTDLKPKTPSEHCASCGTKFLNGRIYLQTSEGLRPAKITFPGADEEQLENIARVSLKAADKIVTTPPTKKRKRNSKSESSDVNTKISKSSPNKDSDENEKSVSKNRRGAKSPPKLSENQRKIVRLEPGSSNPISVKKTLTTKGVREKRVEKKDQKQSTVQVKMETSVDDFEIQSHSSPLGSSDINDSLRDETFVTVKSEFTSESDDNYHSETDNSVIEPRPWTREEDALLLKTVKEAGLQHNTFVTISESLTNRSAQDVQGRCDVLFSLLKKLN